MKAVEYDRYGGSDVLVVREVASPVPRADEVLIRVHAAALNPKDILVRKGRFRLLSGRGFPRRMGYDWAGTVEAIGSNVRGVRIGEHRYGMIERWSAGAFAELVAVRLDETALMPPSLGFEEAAALPLTSLTALQALRDVARVRAGQRLLINGASGGVGVVAIQIAKALGCHVTTTSSERNLALCRSLGADDALDYGRVDAFSGARQFDAIFDVFGNRRFAQARRALSDRGIYVTTVPAKGIALDTARTLVSRQRARLVVVHSRSLDLQLVSHFVQEGRLRPVIDRVMPMTEVAAANDYLATKRARGKIVLRIA
jgi:NADPH:quinone reductase-like Zn-dependent oxidoreductase